MSIVDRLGAYGVKFRRARYDWQKEAVLARLEGIVEGLFESEKITALEKDQAEKWIAEKRATIVRSKRGRKICVKKETGNPVPAPKVEAKKESSEPKKEAGFRIW